MTTRDAAEGRMRTADRIRGVGSIFMVAGGLLLAGASALFVGHSSTQIESWVRQLTFTVVVILLAGGIAFYVCGLSARLVLDQMADDRAEAQARQEAQHKEAMAELRQIKRNQTFLLERPGAGDVRHRYSLAPPSEDTLGLVRQWREEQAAVAEQRPEEPKPVDQERQAFAKGYINGVQRRLRGGRDDLSGESGGSVLPFEKP